MTKNQDLKKKSFFLCVCGGGGGGVAGSGGREFFLTKKKSKVKSQNLFNIDPKHRTMTENMQDNTQGYIDKHEKS